MDYSYERISIKNLLFTKAIPNHVIPIPTNGHNIYACIDCGDKFVFETSYNDHISRKSAKISYMCRYCNHMKIFNNRCNLLSHIRSHAFKTATINVSDLKVELLPMCFYKTKSTPSKQPTCAAKKSLPPETSLKPTSVTSIFCFECKENITTTGIAYKDRTSHFMQYTDEVYSCPVCLFALPNTCALKVHLRLHLQCPPYYCPECGIHLANKNVVYPFNHDCEGFKMMRATARITCTVPDCCTFHPNDYREHMKKYHIKIVYKCPCCVVACFNETTMEKHLKEHKNQSSALIFYQCDICPGKYVMQNPKLNDNHLKSHINSPAFPCWACSSPFKDVSDLIAHFLKIHKQSNVMESAVNAVLNETAILGRPKRIYRVVKRCNQCKRSFTYKCKYNEIQVLPNECPYKCASTMESNVTTEKIQNAEDHTIKCHICNLKISQDWGEVKKHYGEFHKEHKCLDAEVLLNRIDISKYLLPKRRTKAKRSTHQKLGNKISKKTKHLLTSTPSLLRATSSTSDSSQHNIPQYNQESANYVCKICNSCYEQKVTLETHMLTHRDPGMAYQCLECGKSFLVKQSFSKHLLIEHDIEDVDDYLNSKKCYNADTVVKCSNAIEVSDGSLRENQCTICLEQFDDAESFLNHHRVHGMAYLLQNTLNKNNSVKEVH